jgi:hypothetical protein
MLERINKKHERYVPEPSVKEREAIKIDDSNRYIDIRRYYIENYENI